MALAPRSELMAQATALLSQAIQFDKNKRSDLALFSYNEAIECLLKVNSLEALSQQMIEKLHQYVTRAEQLKQIVEAEKRQQAQLQHTQSTEEAEADRAKFLLSQALEADEAGNYNEAVELYLGAVQLCLEKRKTVSLTDSLKNDLALVAEKALNRAEYLKLEKINNHGSPVRPPSLPKDAVTHSLPLPKTIAVGAAEPRAAATVNTALPAASSPSHTPNTNGNAPVSKSGRSHMNSGAETYTKSELAVLRKTSTINGREFVPFLHVDLNERFAYPLPFSDKDGKIALAPKQKASFAAWVRPSDLTADPTMIADSIDCFTIKQSVVSDCSFVASLAVGALYEKRFKKRLISSIIYPQNRNGEPIYNPSGKYMVKLHINGVPRKVVVDDHLPASKYGELLISYSTQKREFWVSLLEKAYMKVMGGYDFPGSNSNIDLHVLTGWIPERLSLRSKTPGNDFNAEKAFQKMFERFHRGDVLITVATGEMSDADGERAGLVPCHAYAVLDIREVLGKRLLMLKNPWRNLRWRGNFSERDVHNWTPAMRTALGYDPKSAAQFDNGVFWIDYDSILHFFDVFYLNWSPDLFHYTFCFHDAWIHGSGPRRDMYDVSNNPQYLLTVNAPPNTASAAVWILLTRHITDRADFADNREFITLVVYKNNGRRVYYPFDPLPFIDGVRINSPHYLCRVWLPAMANKTERFTLVVSEYEKTNSIYFTLRCYATVPFTLQKLTLNLPYKCELRSGQWKGVTAGGCPNHAATYGNNPRHRLVLKSQRGKERLLLQLKGPKEYNVGFELRLVEGGGGGSGENPPGKQQWLTDPFRPGFVVLDLEGVAGGVYELVPSTFHPQEEGPYFVAAFATCPVTLD